MRLTLDVSLPPRTSALERARHVLEVLLSLTGADAQARDHLAVIITEACANVVRHGEPGAAIDLRIVIEHDSCVLEVGNRGEAPGAGQLPAEPPDPGRLDGRGLPLISALSDTAEFVPAAPGYVLLRVTRSLGIGS